MSLRSRDVQPEVMDDPSLSVARHDRALAGLRRLNRLSGSPGAVWRAIRDLAPPTSGGAAPLRVLDVATGGGDVPIGVSRLARRAGTALEIDACDVSDHALAHGRSRTRRSAIGVRFFRLDAVSDEIPGGYDVIVSSLFLHHLDDDAAVSLLVRMANAANRRIVVHDLARSRANLVMVGLAARAVSRSGVVHVDSVRSVRAAFTADEMRDLARRAKLAGAEVRTRFPCRLLMRWDDRSPDPALHDPAPHDPVPHDPVPHDPVPHDPVPHDPVPHDPVPHDPVPHDPVPHDPVPHDPVPGTIDRT